MYFVKIIDTNALIITSYLLVLICENNKGINALIIPIGNLNKLKTFLNIEF